MKTLKRISSMLVATAMVFSLGTVVFAERAANDTYVEGSELNGADPATDTSEIDIVSAITELKDGVYTVNLMYTFKTGVTVTADTQITILGYIFANAGDADANNSAADNTAIAMTGNIALIDQVKLGTLSTGETAYATPIKFAQGTADYQVPENFEMVIKMGTDANVTKAQAFFLNLNNENIEAKGEAYVVGDVNNANGITSDDWIDLKLFVDAGNKGEIAGYESQNTMLEAANVNGKNGVTSDDWIDLKIYVDSGGRTNVEGNLIGTSGTATGK